MPDRQDSMLPSPGRWPRWRIGGPTGGGNQRREVETGRFQCDDGLGEDRMQRSRKGQRMRGFDLQFLPFWCHARVAGKNVVHRHEAKPERTIRGGTSATDLNCGS